MLNGQVFKNQLFENQIFALFINSLYNGQSGILNGYLNIVCTTTSENSSFKTLIDSINKSSESKPPITKITDKIAKYFVPVIMCISIISFGIYLICTHDLELSLNFGISVLVVACPCALALATPIAIMVGTSSAAKNGILIKSGDILQKNGYTVLERVQDFNERERAVLAQYGGKDE